jgi:transposase-like protein
VLNINWQDILKRKRRIADPRKGKKKSGPSPEKYGFKSTTKTKEQREAELARVKRESEADKKATFETKLKNKLNEKSSDIMAGVRRLAISYKEELKEAKKKLKQLEEKHKNTPYDKLVEEEMKILEEDTSEEDWKTMLANGDALAEAKAYVGFRIETVKRNISQIEENIQKINRANRNDVMKILFGYFNESREFLERNDEDFEGFINAPIDRLLGKETEYTRLYKNSVWRYLTYGLGIRDF